MKFLKALVRRMPLMLWDIICVALSVVVSIRLRFPTQANLPPRYIALLPTYIIVFSAIVLLVNLLIGCYNGILKHVGLNDILRQLISSVLCVGLFYTADRVFALGTDYTIFIIMWAFMYLLMISGRGIVKAGSVLRARLLRATGDENRRVLIFGAGEAGVYLASKLIRHAESQLEPVAFIDDNQSIQGKRIHGIKVLGGRDRLDEVIKKHHIDEVIVAIPTAPRELLQFVVDVCKENRCRVRRFGTIDDMDLKKVQVSNINFEDLLHRDRVDLGTQTVTDFIKGKTVMVTGGAGSIGSEICRQVLAFGCEKLIIFDFNENGLFFIDNELKEKFGAERHVTTLGSIRDRARLRQVMTEYKPEIVFHAAAHKHVPMMEINPREAVKNNVFGTINTAQVAIECGVSKFILISTDKAVNPTNIMGATKRIAELIIQMMDTLSDTDFAAVRFGNVLGSNGSVVPFFQKQINEGGPITVTHKDMRRYFMTIPEAVQLVLDAGAMADGGEIFVLDMGQPVRIYDLACDLARLSGLEPGIDIEIKFTGLRPGEKMFEEISLRDEEVDRTRNEKIVIMKPIDNDSTALSQKIKHLESTISADDTHDMFACVKEIVPTFNHKM